MIVTDAGWTRIMSATHDGARITVTPVGPFTGPDSFAQAPACQI